MADYRERLARHNAQQDEYENQYYHKPMIQFNQETDLCNELRSKIPVYMEKKLQVAQKLENLARNIRNILEGGHFQTGADIMQYREEALELIIDFNVFPVSRELLNAKYIK